MRQTAFFFLLLFIQTGVSAQATDYRKQQNYKEWVHLAPKFNDAFFRTEEAQRIGDNVLLYQQVTGGWPKNIYMPAELTSRNTPKHGMRKETSTKVPLTTTPRQLKSNIWPVFIKLHKKRNTKKEY